MGLHVPPFYIFHLITKNMSYMTNLKQIAGSHSHWSQLKTALVVTSEID